VLLNSFLMEALISLQALVPCLLSVLPILTPPGPLITIRQRVTINLLRWLGLINKYGIQPLKINHTRMLLLLLRKSSQW
jgi:hypothetical protein